ncbi:lysosomal cobalamin transporter-related [Anaeramoeba flamelloides]|nr:lysosomal cobalamin transporter-related [Anaeramoeba flamelloides]
MFFYEEEDEETTTKKKFVGALKYTCFTVVIIIVLLLVGLLAKPGSKPDNDSEWVSTMFDSENAGDSCIIFPISCLSLFGCYLFVFYTAPGFGILPFRLMTKTLAGGSEENIEGEISELRKEKDSLEARSSLLGTLTVKDQNHLSNIEKREKDLGEIQGETEKRESSFFLKLLYKLRHLQIFFGAILFIILLFMLTSVLTSLIEKLIKSDCGWKCGFVLEKPSKNPFDLSITAISKVFPIDLLYLSIFVFTFVIVSLAGMAFISIRFLCLKLYSVKRSNTKDQGMLFIALFINLIMITLMMLFHSISYQYTTFGAQKNKSGESCTLNDVGVYDGYCKMSQFSIIVGRIIVKMPFFAIFYYFVDFAFVIIILISIIIMTRKIFFKKTD